MYKKKKDQVIVIPENGEPGYKIAGEIFAKYYKRITGRTLRVCTDNENIFVHSILILIGSDAVNKLSHKLVMDKNLTLNIRYGTDDYHIRSISDKNSQAIILAGGCARSTIYAVYDFFHKNAGVEYFWDGDIIVKRENIEISNCDYVEKPHFNYRGLRYFAHRGLHRFQAEHWDFDDWKKEIDWILKKRMNFFMLRTGIDNLFQMAFPDIVDYPPENGVDPDAIPRSYNDRTSFWTLKYRGILRQKVLNYAFERGLFHPEDTGTMTHWYSRTPSSFLEKRPVTSFLEQSGGQHQELTGKVWDIEKEETWNDYWRLTETHIKKFGQGRLFHTIGLAERKYGNPQEGRKTKLYAYHKIQQKLREHYPESKLLFASWDWFFYWENKDIHRFIKELNPENSIILEYTADHMLRSAYRDWNLYKKFPWIFGIFHAYAPNTEIRGNYELLSKRLRDAYNDEKCLGLVMWPEVSHSDTLMLEYLAANSWNDERLDLKKHLARFCKARYPNDLVDKMFDVWRAFLGISQTKHWGKTLYPEINLDWEAYRDILGTDYYSNIDKEKIKLFQEEYKKLAPLIKKSTKILGNIIILAETHYKNPFFFRDVVDITRTILSRLLHVLFLEQSIQLENWRKNKEDSINIRKTGLVIERMIIIWADLLAQSRDFSLYESFMLLKKKRTINSNSENTLKGNAENSYCRTHVYELVRYVYSEEIKIYLKWIDSKVKDGNKTCWRPDQDQFAIWKKQIQDKFYSRSLASMGPNKERTSANFTDTLKRLCLVLGQIKK